MLDQEPRNNLWVGFEIPSVVELLANGDGGSRMEGHRRVEALIDVDCPCTAAAASEL